MTGIGPLVTVFGNKRADSLRIGILVAAIEDERRTAVHESSV